MTLPVTASSQGFWQSYADAPWPLMRRQEAAQRLQASAQSFILASSSWHSTVCAQTAPAVIASRMAGVA